MVGYNTTCTISYTRLIQADDFGILDFVVKILHFSCFIFGGWQGIGANFDLPPSVKVDSSNPVLS